MTRLWQRFVAPAGDDELNEVDRLLLRGVRLAALVCAGLLLPAAFAVALHARVTLANTFALQLAAQTLLWTCFALSHTPFGRRWAEALLFAEAACASAALVLGDPRTHGQDGALAWVAAFLPVFVATFAPWRPRFGLALGAATALFAALHLSTGLALVALANGIASAIATRAHRVWWNAGAAAREAADAARIAALAADKAKSEFLANMSHEIRTPLTAILGFTDELIDEAARTGTSLGPDPALLTVKRNGHHLLAIVNDVLDLARIEAGKLTVQDVPCAPLRVVADVVSLLRARAIEKQLRLDVRLRGAVPEMIHSDPTRVNQILVNLVGNAIKFTEHGGVTLRLELLPAGPERAAALLAIDVIDTGIGLAPSEHQRIFEAFAQGDASLTRRHGGTGLGLTISRELARLLGGNITVESAPAGGSVFRATLATGSLEGVRMIDSVGSDFLRPTTPATTRPIQRGLEPLRGRVLLAEDGPDNQALISSLLRRAGLEVELASDGQIACEKALAARDSDSPYDLILMDMQMPMMTGYEATAALRREGMTVPIVALTAQAMTGDRDKCLAAGCDEYLSKPVDRGRLLDMVRDLLEKPEAEQGS